MKASTGVGSKIPEADADLSAILGGNRPRRDVGVVVERSQHDLVAGVPSAGQRVGEREGQARHVLAEDNFLRRRGTGEISGGVPRRRDERVRGLAGEKMAVRIRVVSRQIRGHRVTNLRWSLAAAGSIEERRGMVVDGLRERRELGAADAEKIGAGLHGNENCDER